MALSSVASGRADNASDRAALIEMTGIVKVFPPALAALDGVDLRIDEGGIHAIIGENGAGKSTLMRVLYGLVSHQRGSIRYRGQPVSFSFPSEAVRAGIGMIHQEFMLIPSYSVIENVILGAEPIRRNGSIDWRRAITQTTEQMERYGLTVDLHTTVEHLSVSAQQKVEILKLLCRDISVLILDEPSAVLTPQESEQLFRRLRDIVSEQKTVIFISHKLDEVLEISDMITVMRKGRQVATMPNRQVTRQELASMMVGRDVVFSISVPPLQIGEPVLEMRDVTVAGDSHFHIDRLDVHRGEIVGVAGLEGSGQHMLTALLSGQQQPASGTIRILGSEVRDEHTIARRRRLSYVPQDRKIAGSCQQANLISNVIMTHHRNDRALTGLGGIFLNQAKCQAFTRRLVADYQVVSAHIDQDIASLSGGNQQKIIVGREFLLNNPFILLDQPTRGLDVGSIEYIQSRIVELRGRGFGFLLISADLDELQTLADRLVVLYRGHIQATFTRGAADRAAIGEQMLGAAP